MEYGLRLEVPGELPSDPRSVAPPELAARLPEGRLAAVYFGSEFCEDRLPGVDGAERFCRLAEEKGLEATLLTPPVTFTGLDRVGALLEGLGDRGFRPAVVFNDWGVLGLLAGVFPRFPRRAGRLLNRTLRDPRAVEAAGRGQSRAESRGRRLRALLVSRGVEGLETDPDLEGGYLGAAGAGLQRALHLPYAFVTTGRNCLLKEGKGCGEASGGLTAELGVPCEGPCRRGPLPVRRDDTEAPLWRAGNTVFFEAPEPLVDLHLAETDRVVLHGRPAP